MKNLKIITILITSMVIFSCGSKEKTISIKEHIHHDDFEYSVQKVEKMDSIGKVKSNGSFYVITFRVENRAKKVDHEWDNSIAYLVDGSGKEYENQPEQQKNLEQIMDFTMKEKYVTPAGKTESTLLVFDVPLGVNELYLKVRGEYLMGDMFDGNQYKKTKVKLN